MRRVLADRRIRIYECGRRDVATGIIDRRPGHAGLPRRIEPQAAGVGAPMRALVLHVRRQRVLAQQRQRRRHRLDQRHADSRPPGQGLDHRRDNPPAAHPPGHDAPESDHLAHDVRGAPEHDVDVRPRRSIHVGFQPRNAGRPPPSAAARPSSSRSSGRGWSSAWAASTTRASRTSRTSARGVRDRCVGRVQRLGIDCRRVDRLDPPQKQQRGEGGGNHHRSADPVRGADARDQRVLRRIEHVGGDLRGGG